jgi:hypothetical protein
VALEICEIGKYTLWVLPGTAATLPTFLECCSYLTIKETYICRERMYCR